MTSAGLTALLSTCSAAPAPTEDAGPALAPATVRGALAFTVGSAGAGPNAFTLFREATAAAESCAGKVPPQVKSLTVTGLQGGPGTFAVGPVAGSGTVAVALVERAPGASEARLLAESGTVILTEYSFTRVTGSLSVQFPKASGGTTATFDFDPCER